MTLENTNRASHRCLGDFSFLPPLRRACFLLLLLSGSAGNVAVK